MNTNKTPVQTLFLRIASIVVIAVPVAMAAFAVEPTAFERIDRKFLVTAKEAMEWHRFKDRNWPALSGNPSWQQFMGFVEDKLREYGAVDITPNAWTYDYWSTSDWPDNSKWSLTANGKRIRVANYGANSGSTGADGISAPMIFYDRDR